ncbi:hypothetical protein Egran_06509 [Elaphomyces granulatus]|uniref:Uncharacterized protein n=1 Tax=Elaphomyces granulatus TaxID=519963 RepID=A0A232LNP7_9EURO|nr:hypothetical protein Egran_06509 [Elaphomyces granulatus]
MIHLVGKLPEEWQPKWKRMQLDLKPKFREPDKPEENLQISELKRSFDESVQIPSLLPLISVIEGLLRFLPSSRMTASEALDFLRQKPNGVACATSQYHYRPKKLYRTYYLGNSGDEGLVALTLTW